MDNLDDALKEAHGVMSDTVALLRRTQAARQQLEAAPALTPRVDAERRACITLLTALEEEIHRGVETALAALKATHREADGPADRWLRQQLEELTRLAGKAGPSLRRAEGRVVNTVLLAWPLVPPVIAVLVLLGFTSASTHELPRWAVNWGIVVWLFAFDWFAAGVLVALAVLLIRSPARLTRRRIRIAAVSIALDAVGMALHWMVGRWGAWTHGF